MKIPLHYSIIISYNKHLLYQGLSPTLTFGLHPPILMMLVQQNVAGIQDPHKEEDTKITLLLLNSFMFPMMNVQSSRL